MHIAHQTVSCLTDECLAKGDEPPPGRQHVLTMHFPLHWRLVGG